MFQDGQLFNHLTVARNVGYALRLRRSAGIEARVDELLELVGLEGYADRLPGTLSGGERQRVALARCLAVRPRLLLLDEPLSALDTGLRQRLATDLRAILRQEGITALMVTHDHEEAFTVADRLAVMRAGEIVQQGAIDEVWRAPVDAPTALFLGYARVLEGPAAGIVRDGMVASKRLPTTISSRTIPPRRLAVRRSAFRVDPDGRAGGDGGRGQGHAGAGAAGGGRGRGGRAGGGGTTRPAPRCRTGGAAHGGPDPHSGRRRRIRMRPARLRSLH